MAKAKKVDKGLTQKQIDQIVKMVSEGKLPFEAQKLIAHKASEGVRKAGSKLSDAEKQEKISGYDKEITELKGRISSLQSARRNLAKELGLVIAEKVSRSGQGSRWSFGMSVNKKECTFSIREQSKDKPFFCKLPIETKAMRKAKGKGTITYKVIPKEMKYLEFRKAGDYFNLQAGKGSDSYNNISTNTWTSALCSELSKHEIILDGKHSHQSSLKERVGYTS